MILFGIAVRRPQRSLQNNLQFILLATQPQFFKFIDLDLRILSVQLLKKMTFSTHRMTGRNSDLNQIFSFDGVQ